MRWKRVLYIYTEKTDKGYNGYISYLRNVDTRFIFVFATVCTYITTFLLASLFYNLCAKDLWAMEVIYHFSILDEKEIFYLLSNKLRTRKRNLETQCGRNETREGNFWLFKSRYFGVYILNIFFSSSRTRLAPLLVESHKSCRCNVLILAED